MSDVTYRIKSRSSIDGKPLLIVSFNVDYEVLLDTDRFEQLSSTLTTFADGVKGEKLTREEYRLWDDELKRMFGFHNAMAELPPYAKMELETKPSNLPRALFNSILAHFEENKEQQVNVFVTGQAPNLSLNVNWGTVSYSAAVPAGQARGTLEGLTQIMDVAQQCVADGKTKDEIKTAVLETAGAVKATGKVTKEVVECAIAIAVACEFPIAIPTTLKACKEAFDSIVELNDAADAAKAAKEQAERDAAQRRTEAAIDRATHCPVVRDTGIERARDFDGAVIISRTA
ncbi:hypothetical protein [Pseudomonas guariconensis]|uniref:hypothetical protein n=1 Tax=Pseudomonas guariconensis TaxID=1288410 RepID=UPI003905F5B3